MPTEIRLASMLNELSNVGIKAILFTTSPASVTQWFRSTRMFNKAFPKHLFSEHEDAAKLRREYNISFGCISLMDYFDEPIVIAVLR